jgi:hypothetical protein
MRKSPHTQAPPRFIAPDTSSNSCAVIVLVEVPRPSAPGCPRNPTEFRPAACLEIGRRGPASVPPAAPKGAGAPCGAQGAGRDRAGAESDRIGFDRVPAIRIRMWARKTVPPQ